MENLAIKWNIQFEDVMSAFQGVEVALRNDWLNVKVEKLELMTKDPQLSKISEQLVRAKNKEFMKLQKLVNYDYILNKDKKEIMQDISRRAEVAKHHATTFTRTAKITLARSSNFTDAINAGAKKFEYRGPTYNARLFCADKVGRVFTLDEIMGMSNGQLDPVYCFCGGYNCRHRWLPVWDG